MVFSPMHIFKKKAFIFNLFFDVKMQKTEVQQISVCNELVLTKYYGSHGSSNKIVKGIILVFFQFSFYLVFAFTKKFVFCNIYS